MSVDTSAEISAETLAGPFASPVRLILPPDMRLLPAALTLARETLAVFGLDAANARRFELALEEVLANVVQHGFEGGPGEPFELALSRTPLGVEAVVLEKGIPFDPSALHAYAPPKGPDEDDARGLGLHLARSFLDGLEFSILGAQGKKTRLYKRLASAPTPGRSTETPKPGRAKRRNVTYTLRPFEPGDAIAIARCAWRLHGYTFYDEDIYQPERIQARNAEGRMISCVAVTPQGELVAHGALALDDPADRTAELTFLLRDFSLRAQNCTEDVIEELFAQGRARNLAGIITHVVTTHAHTQRISGRHGMVECGLELGSSAAEWDFKWLDGASAQRISELVYCCPLTWPPARRLFPPARHADMIRTIYGRMGAPHEFAPPAHRPAASAEPSRLDVLAHPQEGNATIDVISIGADLLHVVARQVSDLAAQGVVHLLLSLDMADPATFRAGQELEALGFFFSGARPGRDGSDRLFLQRYAGPPLDFSAITLGSETSQELLGYIRQQYQELA